MTKTHEARRMLISRYEEAMTGIRLAMADSDMRCPDPAKPRALAEGLIALLQGSITHEEISLEDEAATRREMRSGAWRSFWDLLRMAVVASVSLAAAKLL